MPRPEHHEPHRPEEPYAPLEWAPALGELLLEPTFACVPEQTTRGAVLMAKAPGAVIDDLPVRVPILLTSQLYQHPAAPVVRLVTAIFDRPRNTLKLESCLNVQDERQRQIREALADQHELPLLFYGKSLAGRQTKTLRVEPDICAQLYEQALVFLEEIRPSQLDFDQAKMAVMRNV